MKYIENTINVKLRFSEVDSLGIVWHGNYLKFFEDGREYLGLQYGMSYNDMHRHKLIMPIVDTELSFKSPLKFGNSAMVKTRMLFSKAAKVIHTYEVYNETTRLLAATGSTTQVFVNENMEMQLNSPVVFENWKNELDWIEA